MVVRHSTNVSCGTITVLPQGCTVREMLQMAGDLRVCRRFGKLQERERRYQACTPEDVMKSIRSIAFGALLVAALYCFVRVLLPDRQAPPADPPSTVVQRRARTVPPRSTARSVEPRVATGPTRSRLSSEGRPALSTGTPQAEPVSSEAPAAAGTNEKKAAPAQGKATTAAAPAPATGTCRTAGSSCAPATSPCSCRTGPTGSPGARTSR